MGQEVACTLRRGGSEDPAKAQLETDHLLIRGAERLVLPYATLTRIEAADGWLHLDGPAGPLALELGTRAAKWAAHAQSPPSRLAKLGVKAGQAAALIGPHDAGLRAELAAAGAVLLDAPGPGSCDLVFYRLTAVADLAGVPGLVPLLKPAGALWTIRPKGKQGVPEAATREAGLAAGLVDVKVARYDDLHTAEKFVIPVAKRAGR
jgi:hypothetical protein